MQLHILSETPSILNQYLIEIRDEQIQRDPLRFRTNLVRIGEFMAIEISKNLKYSKSIINTPLAKSEVQMLKEQPVLCSILRAGLPLHQGILNVFDKAESAFVSAFRKTASNSHGFEIKTEYSASPDLNDKTLIIADPMLATGQSLVATLESLKPFGNPKCIHVACAIGSMEGVDFVSSFLSSKDFLWIAAVDPTLNNKNYIVPGLGDAGDLAFGNKL